MDETKATVRKGTINRGTEESRQETWARIQLKRELQEEGRKEWN